MIKKNTYYLFSGSLSVLCLISCAGPRTSSNVANEDVPASADQTILIRNTDEILQMLSTRRYAGLCDRIEPGDSIPPGGEIARCLLAPKPVSIVLWGWNAGLIQVHVQDSQLQAHATIPITYKTHPNRKLLRGVLTFYFYRRNISGPWFLLPCPDVNASAP